MIAVDTNLLVRLATNDAPAERAAAARLFEGEEILVLKTVLLEAEWVLRSRYGYSPRQVSGFFAHLAALPTVTLEDDEAARRAIAALDAGIDFADALHLASAGSLDFATLDRSLHRKASRLKGVRVRLVAAPAAR